MGILIRAFVDLCRLRMKPQDLPASSPLLGLTLAAHILMSVVAFTANLPFAQACIAGIVNTTLLCGLTIALLTLLRLRERAVQTLTALAGADSVLGFIAYPISYWANGMYEANTVSLVFALPLLAIFGWSLAVWGHILRHALSAPYYLGLLIAIVFNWVSVEIMSGIFPGDG